MNEWMMWSTKNKEKKKDLNLQKFLVEMMKSRKKAFVRSAYSYVCGHASFNIIFVFFYFAFSHMFFSSASFHN